VKNRTDQQVIALEARHPAHQVWVIWKALGGQTWCARPRGSEDARETINASSAEELNALLALADG